MQRRSGSRSGHSGGPAGPGAHPLCGLGATARRCARVACAGADDGGAVRPDRGRAVRHAQRGRADAGVGVPGACWAWALTAQYWTPPDKHIPTLLFTRIRHDLREDISERGYFHTLTWAHRYRPPPVSCCHCHALGLLIDLLTNSILLDEARERYLPTAAVSRGGRCVVCCCCCDDDDNDRVYERYTYMLIANIIYIFLYMHVGTYVCLLMCFIILHIHSITNNS